MAPINTNALSSNFRGVYSKFDRQRDWGESYAQSDFTVNANTSYETTFDSNSHAITTNVVNNGY